MDEPAKAGQFSSQKTPEQIRAERIAAVADPKTRQELDAMVKARDAQLVQVEARQKETFDKRVADVRTQKTNSANGPQFVPSGMLSQYRGKDGYERAHSHAETQIRTHDREYLKNVTKEHNLEIDKRLDAHENVIPIRPQSRAAELITQQNYGERAKQQAELDRQKTQDPARQQQQQRDLQR